MKILDLVYLIGRNRDPMVGQVVGFTKHRVRVAVRHHTAYITLLRAKHNLQLAKRVRAIA